MKLQKSRDFRESAFREEGERIAIHGIAQHAPCVGRRASIPTEPLYEMGAEAPQQQARQRYAVHLAFDDEGKLRGKGRSEHDTVEVARVVRHHYTLPRGQVIGAFHGEPHPRKQKERP
jgi:hypothetical protein